MNRRVSVTIIIVVACLAWAVGASANTVTYSDSIADTLGNWTKSVTIPEFNPALGHLTAIQFSLTADVGGSATAENLGATSDPGTIKQSSTVTLERPDTTSIVVSIPLVTDATTLDPYDGTTDFAGTDSFTWDPLSATDTETATTPPPTSDLALFTGTGNIVLPVKAVASDKWTGDGNDHALFHTYAGAGVTVEYDYYTPEPGSLALLGLGLPMVGLWFRRKRTK
jgi:hypothetical protein